MYWNILRRAGVATVLCALSSVSFSKTVKSCSAADLEGGYGFSFHGTNLGLKVSMLMVGRFEADGKGSFKGTESQSVNGKVLQGPFNGTYVVNPDCTGSADLMFGGPNVEKVNFVMIEDRDEIFLIDVGGNTLESGEAKRQSRKGKK